MLVKDMVDELNRDRREIEARVTEEALAQAEARGLDAPLVWAAGEGWHPGVVGLVATRLVSRFHRPTIIIGEKVIVGFKEDQIKEALGL